MKRFRERCVAIAAGGEGRLGGVRGEADIADFAGLARRLESLHSTVRTHHLLELLHFALVFHLLQLQSLLDFYLLIPNSRQFDDGNIRITRYRREPLDDIVELLGGMPGVNVPESAAASDLPKQERMRLLAEKHFPLVWFSAKDVQSVYEQEMKEPVALSMVSTYLTRLADRGLLSKIGVAQGKRYRLTTPKIESQVSLTKDNK
jgi:hypothetical protein